MDINIETQIYISICIYIYTARLPFSVFKPHREGKPLNPNDAPELVRMLYVDRDRDRYVDIHRAAALLWVQAVSGGEVTQP